MYGMCGFNSGDFHGTYDARTGSARVATRDRDGLDHQLLYARAPTDPNHLHKLPALASQMYFQQFRLIADPGRLPPETS